MKLKMGASTLVLFFLLLLQSEAQVMSIQTDEIHRPKIHFTPAQGWMNDPNGMVYNKGVYHLFYQHNPNASAWGPMHWGHATSKDLISWKHEPIALYPDDNGTIFSGSAVVDVNNTTGFGSNGQQPLVAIYTYHNQERADKGAVDFQTQGLAFSLDNGKSWEKYKGNPVLKNPGIRDFRDPKVMWHEQTKKWVMTLAVLDRIHFYASSNLKVWEKQSEFGVDAGEHGGVWECPDLFPMEVEGKTIWALLVNLNPGGPNKGSATQYFLGQFDGKVFQPLSKQTKWLDYGPDEYAGVTWSNTGSRKLFIGWMSNWMYANVVPTETWRSACTIPRELKLIKVANDFRIASVPVNELNDYTSGVFNKQYPKPNASIQLGDNQGKVSFPFKVTMDMQEAKDFSFVISNEANEKVVIGFDQGANLFYIDRTNAGKKYFHQEFAARHVAPRLTKEKKLELTLVVDVASIELFADQGLTTMTSIVFPSQPYNKASFTSAASIQQLKYIPLRMME